MTQKRFIAADGTRLSYRDIGPVDGPVITLCHGLGASGEQFRDDAAYFAALGYRVLVPDLRGHGQSEAPSGYPLQHFSIPVLAADMSAMLDHAGAAAVHWVGNSLGGIVAFEMVGSNPRRFASLTTFGTAFALSLPALSGPLLVGLYSVFGAGLLSRITALTTTAHRPARPLVAQMLASFDPQVGRAITAHVRRYDLTDKALGYPGPLQIVVGGRDRAVNAVLRPALARIGKRPNLHIVEIPLGGHMANLDANEDWRLALTGFWASPACATAQQA